MHWVGMYLFIIITGIIRTGIITITGLIIGLVTGGVAGRLAQTF